LAGKVKAQDRDLLDSVRRLHSTLTQRTLLLTRVQSNVDIFAEGLRDLGHDFHDLGGRIRTRVTELDADPDHSPRLTPRRARTADRLAELVAERS
jgi:hypothetical protein